MQFSCWGHVLFGFCSQKCTEHMREVQRPRIRGREWAKTMAHDNALSLFHSPRWVLCRKRTLPRFCCDACDGEFRCKVQTIGNTLYTTQTNGIKHTQKIPSEIKLRQSGNSAHTPFLHLLGPIVFDNAVFNHFIVVVVAVVYTHGC